MKRLAKGLLLSGSGVKAAKLGWGIAGSCLFNKMFAAFSFEAVGQSGSFCPAARIALAGEYLFQSKKAFLLEGR
ncbi:hypothetical protein [Heyndrickxia faecalis]|uniref:hypothetical protein n=1 Tax=Heyndrickxia faecalis TaxID=2824910 RepID=UPI001B39F4FA|nr:hypothetical protein [Heyndrickxia faecalis]MBQ4912358.1 hypothetical protein [Heyndrickxia faecalis]